MKFKKIYKTFYINKFCTINKCYAYLFMNIAGNNLDKSCILISIIQINSYHNSFLFSLLTQKKIIHLV